jgi:photosystem II stability/assembly factor-like uncharacterized protein
LARLRRLFIIIDAKRPDGVVPFVDGASSFITNETTEQMKGRPPYCVPALSTVVFCLLVTVPAFSQTSTWTSGGPGVPTGITSLARSSANPDILFAGTYGGVYKSTNGGVTWVQKLEVGMKVIAVSESDPNRMYGGSHDGAMYRSNDGGETWTKKGNITSSSGNTDSAVNALVIHPTNPDIAYAGTGKVLTSWSGENAGIFKTEDGFETLASGYYDGIDAVLSLLLDTSNPDNVYAGVSSSDPGPDRRIRKSTDGGETWTRHFPAEVAMQDIVALAMTPAGYSTPTIYAAVQQKNIFKSVDFGETWTATSLSVVPTNYATLSVDPDKPETVYAGFSDGFYLSPDGGANWNMRRSGLPSDTNCIMTDMLVLPGSGDLTAGCGEGQGVYRSTDGATSWDFVGKTMTGANVRYLAVHPDYANVVYAVLSGDRYKVLKGLDQGTSWFTMPYSPVDLGALAIDPQNRRSVWVGQGYENARNFYVHNSQDGVSWTAYQFGESVYETTMEVTDILIHPENSDYLLVGTNNIFWTAPQRGTGLIARTLDGGANWDEVGPMSSTMAFDPRDTGTIYHGKKNTAQVFETSQIWGPAPQAREITPAGGIGNVYDIEVDMDSNVWAATENGLWKWDQTNWTQITSLSANYVTALAIDHAASPGIVYAGTAYDGVFVSEDGGATWTDFNDGKVIDFPRKLALSEGYLFATSLGEGVWKRNAIATSGVAVDVPDDIPSTFLLEQNYPNPFNPSTTIEFGVPSPAKVRLTVHDALGRLVSTLVDQIMASGVHRAVFNGRNLPSGSYLYRLETPAGTFSKTILLLK